MCGEKLRQTFPSLPTLGSPPHVRGKGFLYFAHEMLEGITPACAGKRIFLISHSSEYEDHPRMCGEKVALPVLAICCRGSPPHVRGKVQNVQSETKKTGITPACAGKSLWLR